MTTDLQTAASLVPAHHRATRRRRAMPDLPSDIAAEIWRGDELGSPVTKTISSGFAALDAELPGGGWPCHALTELLQPQPTVTEWRLLAPSLRQVVSARKSVVMVGCPKPPHLPGLQLGGLDERYLVWVRADAPAQRLWVTEQLVKANACGALIAWLPQARQEQIRRLQVCAAGCESPVFLCRPTAARHESSAAPLRLVVGFSADWELLVQVVKRKGAVHEGQVRLPSVPGGLESVLTPRSRLPSRLIATREVAGALGRTLPQPAELAARIFARAG